jgi:hypothetical protein
MSVLPQSNVLLCVFLWAKELNTKDIRTEIFPVYGWKCLWRKAVHSWVENVSLMTKGLKRRWVKRLLCCGFRRTGKATGQVYRRWWRICREMNVFLQVRISYVLRLISICDIFTDSPAYNMLIYGRIWYLATLWSPVVPEIIDFTALTAS